MKPKANIRGGMSIYEIDIALGVPTLGKVPFSLKGKI
jgi:hypothetical protein